MSILVYAIATCIILPLLYYIARLFWELIPQPLERGLSAIFISGCDTGFGRLLALKCARAGFPVYAGCLTEEGSKRIESEAKLLTGSLVSVRTDITDDASVDAAHKYVVADLAKTPGKKLWALVNNAGVFNIYGPDEWCTINEYKRAVDVNTFGAIRCTHAFLPEIKASLGRIITITSVSGRLATPFCGPYCVSKFGCEAYMDVIRMELADFGVKCCILEPGIFGTPLLDDTQMITRVERVWAPLSPEVKAEYGAEFKNQFVQMWNSFMRSHASTRFDKVVDAYFHALSARFPRSRYRCGLDANLFYIPLSLMPTGIVDFIIRNLIVNEKSTMPAVLAKQKTT